MEEGLRQEDSNSHRLVTHNNPSEIPEKVTYHTKNSIPNYMRASASSVKRSRLPQVDGSSVLGANEEMVNYCIPQPVDAEFFNTCSEVGTITKQSNNYNIPSNQTYFDGNYPNSLDFCNGRRMSSSAVYFPRSTEWSRPQPLRQYHTDGENDDSNLPANTCDLRLLLDAMKNQQSEDVDRDTRGEATKKSDFDQAVLDYIRFKSEICQADGVAKVDKERNFNKEISPSLENTSKLSENCSTKFGEEISTVNCTKTPNARKETENKSNSSNKKGTLCLSPTEILRRNLLQSLEENSRRKRKRCNGDETAHQTAVMGFDEELSTRPQHGSIDENITSFSKARKLLEQTNEVEKANNSNKIRYWEKPPKMKPSYQYLDRVGKSFKRYRDRDAYMTSESESDFPYESKKEKWTYKNERFRASRSYIKSPRPWDKHKYPSVYPNYKTDWEGYRRSYDRKRRKTYKDRYTSSKYSHDANGRQKDFYSDLDSYSTRKFHRNNEKSSQSSRYYAKEYYQGNVSDASISNIYHDNKELTDKHQRSKSKRSNRDSNGHCCEIGENQNSGGIWRTTLDWRNKGKSSNRHPVSNKEGSHAEKAKRQSWNLDDISSDYSSESSSSNCDSSADEATKHSWTIRSDCSGTDSDGEANLQPLEKQNDANTKTRPVVTMNRITLRIKKRQAKQRERVRTLKNQTSKLKKKIRNLKQKVVESKQTESKTDSSDLTDICSQCQTIAETGPEEHGLILTRLGKTATTACCRWAQVKVQHKEEMDRFLSKQKRARDTFKKRLSRKRKKLINFEITKSVQEQSSRWPNFASQIEQRKSDMSFSEIKQAMNNESKTEENSPPCPKQDAASSSIVDVDAIKKEL